MKPETYDFIDDTLVGVEVESETGVAARCVSKSDPTPLDVALLGP